jgi:DNA ligase-1
MPFAFFLGTIGAVRALARALVAASATRSRIEKVAAIAGALEEAAHRGELEVEACARIVVGRLLPPVDSRPLGVGFSIVLEAASLVRGVPEGWIAKRARELGDLGDGVAELLSADTHESRKRTAQGVTVADPRQLTLAKAIDAWALPPEAERHRGLSLRDVTDIAEALASTPSREGKVELVAAAIARATAVEAKYFIKALLGELRVGVAGGIFEEALARAFGATLEDVRAAAAVETDPGTLAVLASRRALASAKARLFHPIAFMLAAPEASVATPIDPALTVVEDKLDGVRAQLHVEGGQARLFARGHGDVGRSFPEIVASFQGARGAFIVDGEILAVGPDARARPFQALQARLGRVDPDRSVLESVPAHYFVFDLLFDEEAILALPWRERRARLEALIAPSGPRAASVIRAAPLASDVPLEEALESAYEGARSRGHEGVVLKRVDAPYEAGRRGGAWRKVKRAFATLDVVVTAAERGHGKRAGVLSDYTFAVWHAGELLDVGKAYTGLTDVEIQSMTQRLEELTVERRGALHRVRPAIVLEVAFDGIQRSKRHPSGFALRFPRIARIRDDKAPEDADDLQTVTRLFQSQVASGHREDQAPSSSKKRRGPQLDLFGLEAARVAPEPTEPDDRERD